MSPLVIGFNSDVSDNDNYLEKLAHANYDRHSMMESTEYREPVQNKRTNSIDSNEIIPFNKPIDAVLSSGPMDSAWPMYCHDTRHTGRSPYSTIDTWDEIWKFKQHKKHNCN